MIELFQYLLVKQNKVFEHAQYYCLILTLSNINNDLKLLIYLTDVS